MPDKICSWCGKIVNDPIRDAAGELYRACKMAIEDLRPGQWLDPDTFACSAECKRALIDKHSYDDLAASGGIVDAP